MPRTSLFACVLLSLIAPLSGCMTSMQAIGPRFGAGQTQNLDRGSHPGPIPFGGVRLYGGLFAAEPSLYAEAALLTLDLPLSLAADVLLLPYTVPVALLSDDDEAASAPSVARR
ncbi:MAG: YceK/YidQ family lipoprotein [Planctomycetes bacterium]|nr:YceK/YidQ family lipoprotein [Planctomycetota bacterium]